MLFTLKHIETHTGHFQLNIKSVTSQCGTDQDHSSRIMWGFKYAFALNYELNKPEKHVDCLESLWNCINFITTHQVIFNLSNTCSTHSSCCRITGIMYKYRPTQHSLCVHMEIKGNYAQHNYMFLHLSMQSFLQFTSPATIRKIHRLQVSCFICKVDALPSLSITFVYFP